MCIKKETLKRVFEVLKIELDKCNSKLSTNKWAFENLTKEQTILKRERVILTELMNTLRKDIGLIK